MGMLQCSELPLPPQYRPSMEYLVGMVHRIKVNGFSIFYEEDFEVCGLGLYGIPSFMNHSCRANALQAFSFRRGSLPSLYVTAFRDIQPSQEICISYTDSSRPSHMRRQQLEEDYYFSCTCEACDNNSYLQDDSVTMAIRCRNCSNVAVSSASSHSTVVRANGGMGPAGRPTYKCTECNTTGFQPAIQQIEAFEKVVSGDGSRGSKTASSQKLHEIYEKLRKTCYTNSWYVQEAGDRVLQKYLEKLPRLVGDPAREQETAWSALKIAEELLDGGYALSSARPTEQQQTDSADSVPSTSAFLRHHQLRFKAARLRLFLVRDPRRPMREVRETLVSLEPYLPKDHPVIAGLKACMENAMM
mmetsp:Transcript_92013/g.187300  ORF Transcript_92013/g.187300 Transcript_92013/m.187300 type:complete len:358 (+) Transcript_92013:1-1074(+)